MPPPGEMPQAEEKPRTSESQYRLLVDNIKEVVFQTDAQGLWVFLNKTWEEVTGFPVKDSLGHVFLDYVHPDDRQRNLELFEPLIQRKKEYCRHEIRYLTREGGFRWIEVYARLVLSEHGEIAGTCGTLTDITERKATQKQIADQLAFTQAIIDAEVDALAVCHGIAEPPYTRFTVWNPSMAALTGYSMEEINRLGWYQTVYVDPEVQEQARQRMERMRQGDHLRGEEWIITRKNGERRVAQIHTVTAAEDDLGVHVLAIMRDVTARNRAEAQERQRFNELQAIYLISNATCGAETLDQIYGEAMESILRTLKANRVSILLFGADGLMHFKAWRNLSDAYRKAADGHCLWARDAVDPQPVLVEDIELDAAWAHFLPVARAEGIRAFGFIPLVLNGHLIGKFMVYFDRPHHFTEDEVRLAKTIAFHITFTTERKQTEQELRIAATAFETSYEGMTITGADRAILKINPAFTRITGYSAEEVLGKSPSILKSGRQDDRFYRDMWESLNRDKFWKGEIWNRRKNGEIYPEWLSIAAVTDPKGNVTHYVGSFSDISLHKESEAQIHALAFYDLLTGLPNRRLLQDRLRHALAANARTGRQGALLFIDLDNFKRINDTWGHADGDLLLIEAASRLQSCTREGDTAARMGGDEFVALLEGLDADEQAAAIQAETVGEKIREVIGQPYLIGDRNHHSTASIGITLFRGPVKTMEEMFKRADAAMYQAKTEGRNTLRFFDPALQATVVARIALESDLRQAIYEQEQFQLFYQAQVDSSGRLAGAEALLRWRHPGRGMVSPASFIPLAEESGLILPLGHWVLATACRQLASWAAQPETAQLTLAVNVSAKQFHQPDFIEEVLKLVDCFGVNPANLKLEITEGMLLGNVEDIISKMGTLKARGINFSMDDFGTGYSSLSYLKRLPLHQLKIDQSFVRDVLTDPNDAAIARTIIALAQSMDLAVIAEGVETEAQREFLERNGCHAFQGYLFSKPVPVEEFEQLVARYPVL